MVIFCCKFSYNLLIKPCLPGVLGGIIMDEKVVQSLLLENKEILHVTGVETVDNFNDETVTLITNKGKLTIKGQKLNISKLNVDEGKLIVKGIMTYSEYENKEKVSLVKRIFK
jgi:sporulation protein YabP